jgi:general stress protein 26
MHLHGKKNDLNHLRDLIRDIPVAMLTTIAEDGSLHARPMINITHEFRGELWFFARDDDPKLREIEANPQVNVSYADAPHSRFVSAAGKASILRDANRCELMWSSACDPWFPDGPRDPHLRLIKIDVESATYWDQHLGSMISLWNQMKNLVTGNKEPATMEANRFDWPIRTQAM